MIALSDKKCGICGDPVRDLGAGWYEDHKPEDCLRVAIRQLTLVLAKLLDKL